jgi:hypothetical protein
MVNRGRYTYKAKLRRHEYIAEPMRPVNDEPRIPALHPQRRPSPISPQAPWYPLLEQESEVWDKITGAQERAGHCHETGTFTRSM